MSLLNLTWRVIAAVTVMVASPAAMGQVHHPFGKPMEFDPDWQFFAPVDVDSIMELSPRNRANEGWFATYDRTYLWVSRPSTEQSSNDGDFGWGNRFDLGLMTDKRSGWLLSFRNMGGPNVYDRTYQERIDRFNANDVNDPNAPVQPFLDANDPQLGTRAYILGDSLNVAGLTNFEINKTWRREPFRYGGVFEPMIGFKYATFKDHALNQTYSRTTATITGAAPTAQEQQEELISYETHITNQMFGGQLGARYFTHYQRWTVSGEFRAFAMSNFQNREFATRTFQTQYGAPPGIGVATTATRFDSSIGTVHSSNNEFVFGFEARAEAAYQITKYFNLRAGVDVLNFAQGIWRGANPLFGDANVHDADVQMAGFTFGVTLNR